MKITPDPVGEYDLLFTSLNEAMEGLEGVEHGTAEQLRETTRLSEEIETLRAITEQVSVDGSALRSLTLG
jgi:archaellum component FlaC